MATEFIPVGFGNVVAARRVSAVVAPVAGPTKRLVQAARDNGHLIDMTNGRRTRAVLVMDTGHLVLISIAPEAVAERTSAPGPGDGT